MNSPFVASLLNQDFNSQNTDLAVLARKQCHGPLHYGEITAFVFRGEKSNQKPMQLQILDDCGIASGEGASMEIDMNQLGPDDMQLHAEDWYTRQIAEGRFSRYDKMAIVFDNSRTNSEALYEAGSKAAFMAQLERDTQPTWWQRAGQALRKMAV